MAGAVLLSLPLVFLVLGRAKSIWPLGDNVIGILVPLLGRTGAALGGASVPAVGTRRSIVPAFATASFSQK